MGVFGGSIEIQMLCWAMLLGLLQIAIVAATTTWDRGIPYNAGPRDDEAPSVTHITGRLERALKNFLETFPLFAAAVIVVTLLNKENVTSGWGAQIYVWARLAYVPVYATGIPFIRTLTWAVSLVGLVMVLFAAAA